ncbi:hypothetical protein EC880221_2284, partial [Escherichia coli 88.0221]
MARTTEP